MLNNCFGYNLTENRWFGISGGLGVQRVYKPSAGLSSEWLRSCPATSARLPHFCLLPAALSTHSYSRKIPGSLNSSLLHWKQSEQAALVLQQPRQGLGGAEPWNGSPRTQLWGWDPASSPACAFGKPQSPTSRLFLVCWGVWRLESKSFRVGACNVPHTNSGKQCFAVAGHQIVSYGWNILRAFKVDSM